MQHIGLDLFRFGGKHYLICMDHWSGHPLFCLLRSLSSDAIIAKLTTWFNLLAGPSQYAVTEAPNSAVPFPVSAFNRTLNTSSQRLTIQRAMA